MLGYTDSATLYLALATEIHEAKEWALLANRRGIKALNTKIGRRRAL